MKYLIILCFLFTKLFAQQVEDIKKEYHNIFSVNVRIQQNNEIVTSSGVNKLPDNSKFAELINNNNLLFSYILFHNNAISNEENKKLLEDTASYNYNYIELLRENVAFNNIIFPIVYKYLSNKNIKTKYHYDKEIVYSKDDIIRVAVRFFYPSSLFNSKLQAHVCIGINGMDDLPFKRDLALEGFLFQTIFTNLDSSKYGIREDFEEAKKMAEDIKLSDNEKIMLNRAQGVVWSVMYNSVGLWKAITDFYIKNKDILPFKIDGV